MPNESLEVTDAQSAAVATHPRVTLVDITNYIAARFEFTADKVCGDHPSHYAGDVEVPMVIEQLGLLSICILVMRNGFTVIGKAAPASPENFNPNLGKKFAYEDAIRQLWPLMGYALKEKLANG